MIKNDSLKKLKSIVSNFLVNIAKYKSSHYDESNAEMKGNRNKTISMKKTFTVRKSLKFPIFFLFIVH